MNLLPFARWILAVALACVGSAADPPPGPRPKGRIEQPVKDVVANTTPTIAEAEALKNIITPKRRIEAPVKETVASTTPAENPTVEAGKVKWHKTVEDAQAAAKKSGKPVLLFQMMGYLDKKFC